MSLDLTTHCFTVIMGSGGSMSNVVGSINSYKPITNTAWVRPGFVNFRKGALDSQPQVIKFTSCLPMVGGSLWVLRLIPLLKTGRHDIDKILLKVALNTKNQSNKSINCIGGEYRLKSLSNLIKITVVSSTPYHELTT